MKNKTVKIIIPSSATRVIVPDMNTSIPDDGFAVATASMDKESDGYFRRKGTAVCGDIFNPTGKLCEQAAEVIVENEKGELMSTATIKLSKEKQTVKGYCAWTFTVGDQKGYSLPERLFKFNEKGKRSDLNRAALLKSLDCMGFFPINNSNEEAFRQIRSHEIKRQN